MKRNSAFTLIEMLLAMAILCLLMTGVLAVVTTVVTPTDDESMPTAPITRVSDRETHVIDAWARLLSEDIQHAVVIDAKSAGRVTMISYRGLDHTDGGGSHRPVQIEYTLATLGNQRCIIRRQAWLDVLTNQNVRRDLVCIGVSEFRIVGTRRAGSGGSGVSGLASSESIPPDPSAVVAAPPLADDSIWYNGLPYFRKTAPSWLIEAAQKQAAEQKQRSEHPPQRPATSPSKAGGATPAASSQSDSGRAGDTLWRLHWASPTEPAGVRILCSTRGGADR